MNNLIEEIKKTNYVENVKIGSIFHMKYKKLYNEILEISKDLEKTHRINTYLRARVIFILKYNNDIENIKKNNKWLTFDRQLDDFIDKTYNPTKQSWVNTEKKINECTDFYNKTETIKILKENDYYKTLYGKSKNRTLINENLKLYNSILFHTNNLNQNTPLKFSEKIKFLSLYDGDEHIIMCKKCNKNHTNFNFYKDKFNELCHDCIKFSENNYPKIGFFKKKYGDDWKKYYELDRKTIKEYKVHSKEWFNKKYREKGDEKYFEYVNKLLTSMENQKSKKCSKISQELFWKIYYELTDELKEKTYFKELNYERYIKDNNGNFYFPDFIIGNKIIEYDGKYWHSSEKDIKRNEFYLKNNYDLLIINENDYRRGYKPNETIIKCVNFLNNENKQ